jgi:hypothetical protein
MPKHSPLKAADSGVGKRAYPTISSGQNRLKSLFLSS